MTSPGGAHARRLEGRTRALLAEQAGLVVPGDGLPVIRARIARRPWWRRVLAYLTASKTAAPDAPGAAAEPTAVKESKVTTIIQRRAREVRAGDIIVRDPDHRDLPVRWRVGRRPTLTGDGVVIIDYTDITDEPRAGIAHFDALTVLAVEPVGGAA